MLSAQMVEILINLNYLYKISIKVFFGGVVCKSKQTAEFRS